MFYIIFHFKPSKSTVFSILAVYLLHQEHVTCSPGRHKWLRPAGLNNSGLEPVLLSNAVFSRGFQTKMLGLLFVKML